MTSKGPFQPKAFHDSVKTGPHHTSFICETRLADHPASQATLHSIRALDGSYRSDIA